MAQRRVHLIANAHLDPVWLWEWEEGAAETLSTFRAAADLCEEFEGFVFNHNEAVLYRWVEEYDPPLFARLQALVREKKWHIMGGWYLQPDCNMPSGESFVRQILCGRRYFRDKFGVDVRTGVNLDPFGHSRGLVQILARSGYDSYLFCRPGQSDCPLAGDEFVWVGYDGSEVMATRASAHYNSRFGQARQRVETWMAGHPDKGVSALLWGIGNHGGGPSRRDLEDLADLLKNRADVEVLHSTPENYFADLALRRADLPRIARSLNPWAVGCYTSMARVKERHRRLENHLFAAEAMAATAYVQNLMAYPSAELEEAQRALCFSEFHDILPGSSVPAAEEGAVRLLDHGLELASRVKARAFFALAAAEAPAADGEFPIFVYNPHPHTLSGMVECEFQPPEPNETEGVLVPRIYRCDKALESQSEKEQSTLSLEWRKKVVFKAELGPSQLNRFTCRLERAADRPRPAERTPGRFIRVSTPDLEVAINVKTGLVDAYRVRGRDLLLESSFLPLVILDNADPWGMSIRNFRNLAGRFRLVSKARAAWLSGVEAPELEPVRIIEDGDVRTIVEALFSFNRSFICQRYKIPKSGVELEVETRVLWNEKDRMLKLRVPTALDQSVCLGQVAFGVEELFQNGDENISQQWTAVVARESGLALTVVNDRVYGSDFAAGELRVSLLRSPAHSADPAAGKPLCSQDRFIPRMDQGEHLFRLWVCGGPAEERLEAVDGEAAAHNEQPFVLAFSPGGGQGLPRPGVCLSDHAVRLAAFKKAEDSDDLIIRLFEPTGRPRTTRVRLPFADSEVTVHLKAFEVKTLKFERAARRFLETDLLERPVIP